MKLKSDRIGRLAACAGLLLAAALLASCGGGGTVVNVFVANRVIAFGDENSVIDRATGGKYTAGFIQDAWSIGRHLTLKPGLRFEQQRNHNHGNGMIFPTPATTRLWRGTPGFDL